MSKIVVSTQKLKRLVKKAIDEFISKDSILLKRELSERALCGALMKRFYDVLNSKGYEEFKDYFVDVEFNRRSQNKTSKGAKIVSDSEPKKNNYVKKIIVSSQYDAEEGKKKHAKIFTDIIVHGRGVLKDDLPDNLIAIEMKKKLRDTASYNARYNALKETDEDRLKQLTCNEDELKKYYDLHDDSKNLVVYDYKLGVFIEINYKNASKIALENNCVKFTFFRHGEKDGEEAFKYF